MAKTRIYGDVKLNGLKAVVNDAIAGSLDEIGARAVELIRAELTTGARSGELMKRDGEVHRASAPGEPPASWSGALAASLSYEVDPSGKGVTVSADAPYANYLEYGTLEIAPRPFIGPVMEELRPEIDAILARAFDKNGQSSSKTQSSKTQTTKGQGK